MLCKEKTGILGVHTLSEAKFRVIIRSFALWFTGLENRWVEWRKPPYD